ncbi:hypothetical protein BJV74DRAFT_952125 [Russula compacta]|nr:hypothetical protein BJV74DRAFT_952125 [Russula compacta]
MALSTYMLYWYLIQNFADIENLDNESWSMVLQVCLTSFVAFMIQLFYARRLYLMSHNIALVVIIIGLTVFVFAICMVFSIRGAMLGRYSRDRSLIWLLSENWVFKNRFHDQDPDGLCYQHWHVDEQDQFAISPTTLIAQAFYRPLGTCYVNSLLALLNNRKSIRDGSDPDSNRTNHNAKTGPTSISVNVHRTASMAVELTKSKHDSEVEATALELEELEDASISSPHEGFSKSVA